MTPSSVQIRAVAKIHRAGPVGHVARRPRGAAGHEGGRPRGAAGHRGDETPDARTRLPAGAPPADYFSKGDGSVLVTARARTEAEEERWRKRCRPARISHVSPTRSGASCWLTATGCS